MVIGEPVNGLRVSGIITDTKKKTGQIEETGNGKRENNQNTQSIFSFMYILLLISFYYYYLNECI